jgi:hypothetical protein
VDTQTQNGLVLQRIPIMSKALAARFNGSEHQGVAIFPVFPAQTLDADPEWQALVGWVAGKAQPKQLDKSCADFFMALGLPPK